MSCSGLYSSKPSLRSRHARAPFVTSLFLLASITSLSAQRRIAHNTSGPALSAIATFQQTCCGICRARATVNGLTTGAHLGNNVYDFWAAWPSNRTRSESILWAFTGGIRVVSAMQVLTYYFASGSYGPHRIGDFRLQYTTDAVPKLNGSFAPLQKLAINTRATITGNRILVTPRGVDDYRISFTPVVATGILLTNAPNSGISNNKNYVITEVSFQTVTPGVLEFGGSTVGCRGSLPIGVSEPPRVGTPLFKLTCANAPPSGSGFLLVGTGALRQPIPLLGLQLWTAPPWFLLPVSSNRSGYAVTGIPIPANPKLRGLMAFPQYVWRGSTCPPGLSASAALQLTIL